MEIQPDFKELLALFNAHRVEYAVVGGYALAFHGAPRATGDIDILVRPTEENAQRVLDVLNEFGFGSLKFEISDFATDGKVVQLGRPPVRIDLMTSIDGVDWGQVHRGLERGFYGGLDVNYLGRDEFILNKKTVGRKKDLVDVESLEQNED